MTKINQRSDVKWESYLACGVIEGFEQVEGDAQETQIEAWAYLIATGKCWSLQGFYGRGASHMIESGVINKDGKINWEVVDTSR